MKKCVSKNSNMILVERNKVLMDDAKAEQTFNTFFSNIVETLNIAGDESILSDTRNCRSRHQRCSRKKMFLKNSKNSQGIMPQVCNFT